MKVSASAQYGLSPKQHRRDRDRSAGGWRGAVWRLVPTGAAGPAYTWRWASLGYVPLRSGV